MFFCRLNFSELFSQLFVVHVANIKMISVLFSFVRSNLQMKFCAKIDNLFSNEKSKNEKREKDESCDTQI